MRKDAGLNGDLDRIPQLAWLLFLKAFDGLEENREVTERDFRPAIEAPYRWRDWAADHGVGGGTGECPLPGACHAGLPPESLTPATGRNETPRTLSVSNARRAC